MIEVKSDERLFTALCALNLCGYDDKNCREFHPVRAKIREELMSKNLKSKKKICCFIKEVKKDNVIKGHSLHLSEPPFFKIAIEREVKNKWILEMLEKLNGFEEALTDFYNEADIHSFWLEHKKAYEDETESFEKVIREKKPIKMLEKFLRMKHPYKKFIVIVDLMEPCFRGMVVTQGSTLISVSGPRLGCQNSHENILHEALHPVMKPLMEKHKDIGVKTEWRDTDIQKGTQAGDYYLNWRSRLEETIIRTIVCHCLYSNKESIDKEVRSLVAEKQGFIHAPLVSEAIEEYKSQNDKNFREFFPKILKKLL